MTGVTETIGLGLSKIYASTLSGMPLFVQNFINLFVLVLLIVVYSVFIWNFYRFIATKNIFGLNLNKYNKSSRPFTTKLIAGTLYFLEYIIILPFVIFFGFTFFTIFLMFLTENLTIQALLLISASVIAAIRMTSYYNENLSKDLAKLLPFTLLAISLLNPNFFNIERIFALFKELPVFFDAILTYLVFIILLEIILRFFDFIFSLFGIDESEE